MYFELDKDEQAIVDNLRKFLERSIRPAIEAIGERAPTTEESMWFLKQLSPLGPGRMFTPEADGGFGLSNILTGRMIEEISRIDGGLGGFVSLHDGTVGQFARMAPAHLKEKYLPKLLAGEMTICTGVTEPDVGSNPREIRTRAKATGNGTLRLQGEKTWISNAPAADLAIIICRTSDDPREALSMVLMDRHEHGYQTSTLKKLGLDNWPTGQVLFDTEVPEDHLLGPEGGGLSATLRLFERARCFVGIISLGIAQAALEAAIDYAKTRVQWGKPIAAHQSIQIKLAEMATDLDAARLLVYRGLVLVDRGARCDTQTSMAKLYATEAAIRITHRALEVFGANGLSPDYPVNRLFRDARVLSVPDGTSDIQRLLIARNLTGAAAF